MVSDPGLASIPDINYLTFEQLDQQTKHGNHIGAMLVQCWCSAYRVECSVEGSILGVIWSPERLNRVIS